MMKHFGEMGVGLIVVLTVIGAIAAGTGGLVAGAGIGTVVAYLDPQKY